MKIVHGLIIILIISSVESLKHLQEKFESQSQDSNLRNLVNMILSAYQNGPRRLNAGSLATAREMYKKITKDMTKSEIKDWLRQRKQLSENSIGSDPALVESELQSLQDQKTALLNRPYVEKRGENDFLVMQSATKDSYVTVIPNAIYYNIQKKCVNWLDDCSLRGIRERLITGVRS